MGLRKIFNIPTKEQKDLISVDVDSINNRCEELANEERRDQRDFVERRDSICPHCKKSGDDIVDKIADVGGKGNVSGSFALGFGSVSGGMSVSTGAVNHCNGCGNEWAKAKTKSISRTDIVRVALKYLSEVLKDREQKRFDWKMEAIKSFDDCCAESIRFFYKRNEAYTYSKLRLSKLRRYYPSVYDGKNKKKLEKI